MKYLNKKTKKKNKPKNNKKFSIYKQKKKNSDDWKS